MASYFNLTLDTLPPQGVSILINSGATTVGSSNVDAVIGCTCPSTTGYTMKIYGDIYLESLENTAALTESEVSWETYSTAKSLILLGADGQKTVRLKVRDDVHNTTAEIVAVVTLDTIIPTVTVNGPDVAKISEQANKNMSSFTFTSDKAYTQYKIMVVPNPTALQNNASNMQIPATSGSVNMQGTDTFAALTPISCSINGTDLKTAVGGSDNAYIIKVFVFDGVHWSA